MYFLLFVQKKVQRKAHSCFVFGCRI